MLYVLIELSVVGNFSFHGRNRNVYMITGSTGTGRTHVLEHPQHFSSALALALTPPQIDESVKNDASMNVCTV